MEDEKCYVFHKPPAKSKQKFSSETRPIGASFQKRKAIYISVWEQQEKAFNDIVQNADAETVDALLEFVDSPSSDTDRIPTGIIQVTAGSNQQISVLNQFNERITQDSDCIFITLSPFDGVNLKTLLRTLIQRALRLYDHRETIFYNSNGVSKLLNYDLRVLQNLCKANGITKIILVIPDSEAFDIHVLTDFVALLHSWLDRLRFWLFFGVSTSVDIFYDRLPRSAIRTMRGISFQVTRSSEVLERIFENSVAGSHVKLRLGPVISNLIMHRYEDHTLSVDTYQDAWKYAAMSHFYGNTLSIFQKVDLKFEDCDHLLFESLRNLPSFQEQVEHLVERQERELAFKIIQDDAALFEYVVMAYERSLNQIEWAIGCIKIVLLLQQNMAIKSKLSFAALYSRILSAGFVESAMMRDLLLSARRLPLNTLAKILPQIINILISMPPGVDVSPDDFSDLQDQVNDIINKDTDAVDATVSETNSKQALPARSRLKNAASIGRLDGLATHDSLKRATILSRFHNLLHSYLQKAIVRVDNVFLNEILFYDLRSPYRDVFTPRPKYCIERALATPHDYLGCSCCEGKETALSSFQPATAILYQLYLESGALINAYDLWAAFQTIVGEEQEDEKVTMGLFYRALAELKYLGMIKSSRKKVDHLAKLAWKGM